MNDRPGARVAIYARAARHDDDNLNRQVVECTQYAHAHGYNPVDVYVDNGVSAFADHRPELDDLLTNIGHYSIVVVWNLDRLWRKPADMTRIVDHLEAHGTELVTVTDSRPTLRVVKGESK